MITAKHHIVIYYFFKWLNGFLLRRNFNTVNVEGKFEDNGSSVLVVANHISWWDGFWVEYLNRKRIHRKFYFMMLEEQLKRYRFFQYCGGFSVKKGSREVVDSIDYTLELLSKDENMVLMFPQGKIYSSYNSEVLFESGIQHIIERCKDETQVIFVVNLTDYFSDSKPNLFIYTKVCTAGSLRHGSVEDEYNGFLSMVMECHKTKSS
jgi:1-acyl-sn-glycerol-3-phosphate acyltransferase